MEITFEPLRCTKELILKKVSQEELMEYYVGIPVKPGLFRSPFRSDKTPTVGYYKSKNGDIIYKDFGFPDHCGNFISMVMIKYNCSYAKAMQIIGNDFGILSRPNLETHSAELQYTGSKLEEHHDAVIQVEIRDFQDYELKWWQSYGISRETLQKFNVYSCKNVWLNGELFCLDNKQHLYGYYGGKRNDLERWKIYRPGKKKFKFLSNWTSNMIQGAHMLSKDGGELLIVQKSMKDVMLLYEHGIQSIAPMSENTFLSESIINKLKSKYKRIIFWFDNDTTGMNCLEKVKIQHPELEYYYLPIECGCKDLTDYRKEYGKEKTKELISSIIGSEERKDK